MAKVLVRVVLAVVALAVVAAFAVQLRAHDMLANAGEVVAQPKPKAADVDAQLGELETVADLRPGSQAPLTSASLNLRTGRYRAAVRDATRATQRDPKNFSAWVTLGVARGALGDGAGRRAAFAKAHALNPLYPIPR